MNINFNALRFIVLPGNPEPMFASSELYDASYRHFKSVWERTFTRRIGPQGYDAYGFFRQDFIMLLMHGDDIAGQLCSSLLNLESSIASDLSYLKNFDSGAQTLLRDRNCKTFATLEYSSISPNFSPRKVNFCLNDFINVLGAKYVFSRGADAAGGLPRRITGTNQKVLEAGYLKVSEKKERLGLTVDVVLGFKDQIKYAGSDFANDHLQRIWDERTDLTFSRSHLTESRRELLNEQY